MTLHRFYLEVQLRTKRSQGKERYAQAMFNHLSEVKPNLASQVTGTDKDPFYITTMSDPTWHKFITFIESNWGN